jgi:hypothetical protein
MMKAAIDFTQVSIHFGPIYLCMLPVHVISQDTQDNDGRTLAQIRVNARNIDRSRFTCNDPQQNMISALANSLDPANRHIIESGASELLNGTLNICFYLLSFSNDDDDNNDDVPDSPQRILCLDNGAPTTFCAKPLDKETLLRAIAWISNDTSLVSEDDLGDYTSHEDKLTACADYMKRLEEVKIGSFQEIIAFLKTHPPQWDPLLQRTN